jgi:hypothetical protein
MRNNINNLTFGNILMCKIFRICERRFVGWRVILLVLTWVCWCNQAICVAGARGTLTGQDIADLNALLPSLTNAGQGLWVAPRGNPSTRKPGETVQQHYNVGHGPIASDTKTLPFFNGVPLASVAGPNPITAEEVVMANFIATIPPFPPVVPLAMAQRRIKRGDVREILIPVPLCPVGMAPILRIPAPVKQIQVEKPDGTQADAQYCSIMLPKELPVPAGAQPGTLAPPPPNVCTLYFRQ